MLVLCSKHHLNLKQCKAIPEVFVWGGGAYYCPVTVEMNIWEGLL